MSERDVIMLFFFSNKFENMRSFSLNVPLHSGLSNDLQSGQFKKECNHCVQCSNVYVKNNVKESLRKKNKSFQKTESEFKETRRAIENSG